MTSNGKPPTNGKPLTSDHLTPAESRCLAAYRDAAEQSGRAPFLDELAGRQGGIRKESAMRLVEKLRAKGFSLPLSLRSRFSRERCAFVGMEERPVSAAEAEMAKVRELFRLADRIVSRYGDPEDCEWSQFRRDAAPYLTRGGCP
jgi:hypothetical protein